MLNLSKCINEILYNRRVLLNFSYQSCRKKTSRHDDGYPGKTGYERKLFELKDKDIADDGEMVYFSEVLSKPCNGRKFDESSGKNDKSEITLNPCQVINKGKLNLFCEQLFSVFTLRSSGNVVLFQCSICNNTDIKRNYCSNLPRKVCHPKGTICPIQICKPPAVPKRRPEEFSLIALRLILLLATLISTGTIFGILYKRWDKKRVEEQLISSGNYQVNKSKQMRPELKFERKPCCSEDLPEEVPYLMVGGGPASYSACSAIRQKESDAKILILMNEPYRPYRRAPLSKIMIYYKDREFAKKFKYTDRTGTVHSLFFEKEDFYLDPNELPNAERGGIAVAHGWPVVKVNPVEKVVTLDDGKKIKYTKKCLLATGSSPKKLEILRELQPEILKQISYYGSLYDFKKLEEVIENGADSIVIYGGGFLGCELTSSLAKRGKETELKITHVIREECVMDEILPKYLTRWLTDKILHKGNITFINNSAILALYLNEEGKLEIHLSHDKIITCDHLLVCIGSVANTDLAKLSGLEICKKTSAFVANPELQVRTDLFTAGDCGSFYDIFLDERLNVRHHDYALYTGKLAGENMVGGTKSIDHQSIFFSEVGATMDYEAVGFTHAELPTVGIFAVKATEKTDSEPPTLPDDIDYSKGVIFYLKDDIIVGAVLWNLPNRLPLVRKIISGKKAYKDLNTISQILELHN